ncbi:hypothetical protein [Roseofilum capinflatum]|uniref:Uncharacterized protein n=1 Tax=Roseofilum capinflatum BLCC-M114 TaxID=3022440 RepID=A0ABT7B6U5_9CYAN|nr:hypothetical protein [Roseofilum capinflatum]MDJ1174879.1 hypothetical protein [Roseofilum capinflatum BLCC-M114]
MITDLTPLEIEEVKNFIDKLPLTGTEAEIKEARAILKANLLTVHLLVTGKTKVPESARYWIDWMAFIDEGQNDD